VDSSIFTEEESAMAKSKMGNRYAPEFRRQMVELVRAGRKPPELSKEFGCSTWSIRGWVKQADRDAGRGDGGLTGAEREELTKLRRENRQLKLEREILSKAAAWFAQETRRTRSALRIRESEPGHPSGTGDVPAARCFGERLLRLAGAPALEAGTPGCGADGEDSRDPSSLA
jgi:transposase